MRGWIVGLCLMMSVVAAADDRPDVLLVVWDTTRADHLTPYGYERNTTPNLGAWAKNAVVFEHAESAAAWTAPSVASMLTGLFTHNHLTGHAPKDPPLGLRDDVVTLAEAFQSAGYRTGMFVQNTVFTGKSGFNQGFDIYKQSRNTDLVNEPVAFFDASEGPAFAIVYWMDPHAAYEPAPEHDKWSKKTGLNLSSGAVEDLPASWVTHGQVNGGSRELTPAEYRELEALYDGELHENDAELGALLDGLDGLNRGRERVMAFTADHAESFGEHPDARVWHSAPYDAVLHVPLIVSGPTMKPGRVAPRVRIIDIYPTLLELAGVSITHAINGESLVGLSSGRPAGIRANGGGMHFSRAPVFFRGERYKLIERRLGPPNPQLFDIVEDPDESRNLAEAMPELLDAVRARHTLWLQETRLEGQGPDSPMTNDERERLRALGYVE